VIEYIIQIRDGAEWEDKLDYIKLSNAEYTLEVFRTQSPHDKYRLIKRTTVVNEEIIGYEGDNK
jgi:hypothetical protein